MPAFISAPPYSSDIVICASFLLNVSFSPFFHDFIGPHRSALPAFRPYYFQLPGWTGSGDRLGTLPGDEERFRMSFVTPVPCQGHRPSIIPATNLWRGSWIGFGGRSFSINPRNQSVLINQTGVSKNVRFDMSRPITATVQNLNANIRTIYVHPTRDRK